MVKPKLTQLLTIKDKRTVTDLLLSTPHQIRMFLLTNQQLVWQGEIPNKILSQIIFILIIAQGELMNSQNILVVKSRDRILIMLGRLVQMQQIIVRIIFILVVPRTWQTLWDKARHQKVCRTLSLFKSLRAEWVLLHEWRWIETWYQIIMAPQLFKQVLTFSQITKANTWSTVDSMINNRPRQVHAHPRRFKSSELSHVIKNQLARALILDLIKVLKPLSWENRDKKIARSRFQMSPSRSLDPTISHLNHKIQITLKLLVLQVRKVDSTPHQPEILTTTIYQLVFHHRIQAWSLETQDKKNLFEFLKKQ